MGNDLSLHVDRERRQRYDSRREWSYGLWMAARRRAREAEQRDQLRMIEEEAGEAVERGYSRSS